MSAVTVSVKGKATGQFNVVQPLLPDGSEYKTLTRTQRDVYTAHQHLYLTLKDMAGDKFVPERHKSDIKSVIGADAFINPEAYLNDQNAFRRHPKFNGMA